MHMCRLEDEAGQAQMLASLPPCSAMQSLVPVAAPLGVRVWRLQLDLLRGQLSELLAPLPGIERERCLRYRRPVDRLRYAAARLVLRHVLALHVNRAPHSLVIEPDACGKPQLLDAQGWHFNLSHSGRHVLLAFSNRGPVGIDVERVATDVPWPDMQACLTPAERTYCALSTNPQAFFRVWCGKEAVLKALGVGIAQHLPHISVLPTARRRYALALQMMAPPVQAWQLSAPHGCVAALAVSDPVAAMFGQETKVTPERG